MGKVSIKEITRNQVLRFLLSAGSGYLVDISCYYLLFYFVFKNNFYNVLGMQLTNITVVLAVSYFLGVMVNFLMTRYIVFTESQTSFSKQFFRFTTVAIIGFFANKYLIDLAVHDMKMYPPVARALVPLCLFFASFFIHKVFSFSLSLRHHAATHSKSGN